ncbi:MAG: ABC transporter ATP-binding protein [Hyphomicrobiaceae bacterium]|nr:ABC transporter ATP-binding protein [Hyphomicrobiaceae bacterium]MCC0010600.1 ABC transporter ATP-binding protein [Hyphomicrobiaceae bacterium]
MDWSVKGLLGQRGVNAAETRASGSVGGPVSSGGLRAAATFAARLTFENVTRRYDNANALSGVDLDIAPGEVVCLLGPSGCGKTTLLRIASGIERPTSGRVLINDREVAGPDRFVPPEERSVGLMFQDFALFPHLTILQNVAFGLKALPADVARREAMSVLSRVGLESYASSYPHILSGGQQQRVALARAIVPRPSVVLMDEPFSGLDVQLRDSMQEETLSLLRETRATCMIVTHHPEEAMRMSDRIAVMRRGRIVQLGRAEELYHHPAELFVARMFSEINELEVTVKNGGIDMPFGHVAAAGIADGEQAMMCIRERGIRLHPAGRCGLAGRVLHVKFLGDVGLVEIGVHGFDEPLRARTRVAVGEVWSKGAEVGVEIDPARILVFPKQVHEHK